MKAKGCISDILDWSTSRTFLYWRLRRRLLETKLVRDIMVANPKTTYKEGADIVRHWLMDSELDSERYNDNKAVTDWLVNHKDELQHKIDEIHRSYQLGLIVDIGKENSDISLDAIAQLVQNLNLVQREK
eukprot:Ihof_evm1s9 gene=Ihof_evmTU1s9